MHTDDYDGSGSGSGGDGRQAVPRTGTDTGTDARTGAGAGPEPVVRGHGQGLGQGPVVLVTGATGTVGGEVVRALPTRLPAGMGMGVRVMARDPARAAAMFPGVEAVAGDYTDPPSLASALRGVRTAFLVTARVEGDDDAAFVAAARAAGVRRVVKLSAAAVLDPGADDLITRRQRAGEETLRGCGLEWTLLRPRAFMSNSLSWAASVRRERTVRALYGSAPNACVDPRDIAEVAARALTEEGHAGHAYTLTGPQALTAVEQTRQLGRLLGIPLRFEELTVAQARTALAGRFPPPLVEALLASAERQRAGAKAHVDDTVHTLTGHPARTFHDWARDHIKAFTPAPEPDPTVAPAPDATPDPVATSTPPSAPAGTVTRRPTL
ncbi:NAD(P)H-binding protein [Streptomyces sp. NPDC086082]|uniref:NAD(P)H-binding protein n=1 Tax=Streptomyces sp. NPDC086082 TaxID=3365750 RepID=UPI00381703BF